MGGGALAAATALPRLLADHPNVRRKQWRIGHHFWNWDHAWNNAAFLDERPGVFAGPDTGHLSLCGSDPVQTIRDLGSRCRYVHLKDLPASSVNNRRTPGEKFCELGRGALDLAGVIKALEDIGYEGWIMIERDSREPDYGQSARNMRAVLKRFGY